MITYAVVEFEEEKTVAVVCRKWIVGNVNVNIAIFRFYGENKEFIV